MTLLAPAGDYVDRGSWGAETLVAFALLKLALPERVTMLRGNHETTTCVQCYGFEMEITSKYDAVTDAAIKKLMRPVRSADPPRRPRH